jgi:hypothetical protein
MTSSAHAQSAVHYEELAGRVAALEGQLARALAVLTDLDSLVCEIDEAARIGAAERLAHLEGRTDRTDSALGHMLDSIRSALDDDGDRPARPHLRLVTDDTDDDR